MERFADALDLVQIRIDQVTDLAIAQIRKRGSLTAGRHSCLDCGDSIPAKRLACVPNATRCASCQDDQERYHATASAHRGPINPTLRLVAAAPPGLPFGVSSSLGTGRTKRTKD